MMIYQCKISLESGQKCCLDHFLYFCARHWVEFKQVIVSIWHVDVGRAVAVIQPVRHDKKFSRQVSLAETNKRLNSFAKVCLSFVY